MSGGKTMKKTKKLLSVLLACVITAVSLTAIACAAGTSDDYVIKSPYEAMNSSEYKAYKGSLHTHSSVSDGNETFRNMIYGAYEQEYDILAFAEHGITGREWNKTPFIRPLYLYQYAAGNDKKCLTDEEYKAVTQGSAALSSTGEARGRGMLCVPGANELNGVTVSKSHVNGYFLPENVANMEWGFENGYDYALSLVEKYGGISHINHPSDFLDTGTDESVVSDPKNVKFFADFLLRYDSCLGIEAVNGFTSLSRYDRILWDNLLMECLPYGKTVYGFAGPDAHDIGRLNSCYMYFMMNELSLDALRECLETGAFFGATHTVCANTVIGPEQDLNAPAGVNQPLAKVNSITVKNHTITIDAENTSYINWIANGKVIARSDINGDGTVELNLDDCNSDGMLYIRAELYNENGLLFTQPLTIDRGEAPLEYKNEKTISQKLLFAIESTRIVVLIKKLVSLLVKKIGCGM